VFSDLRDPVGTAHSVVFLTGYPHAAIPIEYRGASLVSKPFEPNEMKEVLSYMLGLSQDLPLTEHLWSGVRH
jgi:hypothetical protein